jgi:DNA polymerase alpha subunit A
VVVQRIHSKLEEVAKSMRADEIPVQDYVITKGLNKAVKDYPDAKNQPHLQVVESRRHGVARSLRTPSQVALAMQKMGKPVNTGDHIPYVICIKVVRARSPPRGR